MRRKRTRPDERHGLSGTPEHRVWSDLFQRCYNTKSGVFRHYGGRGIKVCERWHRFTRFLADMGSRPSELHSIDRLDNDGDYEPANCRWATRAEQARNRRDTVFITHDGYTLCIADWAQATGLSAATIHRRYHEGLPPEQILASARQWTMIAWKGETMPARTWARRLGIPETTFMRRVKNRWPIDMVMADPIVAARYTQERYWAAQAKKAEVSALVTLQRAETDVTVTKNAAYERALDAQA